jgi:hypothetical protein
MSTAKLEEKVIAATQRLARVKAKALLKQMRDEHRTRELERRKLHQRRLALADAVLASPVADWHPSEVLGLLLHGASDVGETPQARASLRKQGDLARFGRVEEKPPTQS